MDDFSDIQLKPLTKGLGFKTKLKSVEGSQDIKPKLEKAKSLKPEFTSQVLAEMMNSLPPHMDFTEESGDRKIEEKVLGFSNKNKANVLPPLLKKNTVQEVTDNRQKISLFEADSVLQPLPLKSKTRTTRNLNSQIKSVPSIPRANSKHKKSIDESLAKAFPQRELNLKVKTNHKPNLNTLKSEEIKPWVHISSSALGSFFDLVSVLALTIIFYVSMLMVAGNGLNTYGFSSLEQWKRLSLLFSGLFILYYLASRSLFDQTLGDWVFNVKLGNKKQRLSVWYPVQVLARAIVHLASGFLVSIISFIFNIDITSYLTGLKLFKKAD